jgi:glycosyltransferase involved in cell wall biosynthesis
LPLFDPGKRDRAPDGLRVFVLLPTTKPYGGVISAVNSVNVMIDRGHQVTIASQSRQGIDLVFPRSEPIYLPLNAKLATSLLGSYDIVMATFWTTVKPVRALADTTGASPIYFVQDYEPDFYSDMKRRRAARSTYDQIPHRVVKTAFLQRLLLQEGGWSSHRIRPGMNLDIFYPRVPFDERPQDVVLGMARPDPAVDRRGMLILKDVFEELHRLRPELKVKIFGSGDASAFDCPVEALGTVEPSQLPHVYSNSTIFVETSRRHGFGRTGVEAMATGTPCVLSDSGGISEYARHGDNCLVVPVADVRETVDSIIALLDDQHMRSRFSVAGIRTVSDFSDYSAAEDLVSVFRTIIAS